MSTINSKLTVMFSEPFWIAVYEREGNSCYEVCKITFGAEPRDYQVYDFMLKNWSKLRFSPSIQFRLVEEKHISHKRMQRLINKQVQNTGIGTKAQQALKLQQEQKKTEIKNHSSKQREAEKQRQFEIRQKKRKAKHRGH